MDGSGRQVRAPYPTHGSETRAQGGPVAEDEDEDEKTETDWHVEAANMTAEAARTQIGEALYDLLGPEVAKKVAWRQANKSPEKRARWLAGDLFVCVLLDGPFESWDGLSPVARKRATAALVVIVALVAVFIASFFVPQTGAGLLVGEIMRLPAYLAVPFILVCLIVGVLAPDARRGARVRPAVLAGALVAALAAAVVLPGGALTIAADAPYAARPLAGTVRVIGVMEDDSGDSTTYSLYVAADDLPGHTSGDYLRFDIDSGRYDQLVTWCDDLPTYMGDIGLMTRQAQEAAANDKPLARIEMLPGSGTLVSITREDG